MFTTTLFAATALSLLLASRAPFAAVAIAGCTPSASTLAKRNWMGHATKGNHTHIYGGGLGETT